MGDCGLDLSDLGYKDIEGCYEYGNEISGYIKCFEFINYYDI